MKRSTSKGLKQLHPKGKGTVGPSRSIVDTTPLIFRMVGRKQYEQIVVRVV